MGALSLQTVWIYTCRYRARRHYILTDTKSTSKVKSILTSSWVEMEGLQLYKYSVIIQDECQVVLNITSRIYQTEIHLICHPNKKSICRIWIYIYKLIRMKVKNF